MPRVLAERFWSKVDKSGGPEACWPWTASKDKHGYGRLSSHKGQSPWKAHRVAWELTHGPIPDGHGVLHECDNPPCCNPNTGHLFTGTQKDNAADRDRKGRSMDHLKRRPGELNGSARLTEPQVEQIRRRRQEGEGATVLAREFLVSPSMIRKITRGTNWKDTYHAEP